MSNSLDPDQVRHFAGPDMGPNFLAKEISRQRSQNELMLFKSPPMGFYKNRRKMTFISEEQLPNFEGNKVNIEEQGT